MWTTTKGGKRQYWGTFGGLVKSVKLLETPYLEALDGRGFQYWLRYTENKSLLETTLSKSKEKEVK